MNEVLGFFELLLNVTYLYIVAIFKAIVPTQFLTKKNIAGKKVLVTGSASGLGRQLAIGFGEVGAEVVLWDVNQNGNTETLNILHKNGVKATAYHVNLCDSKDINEKADLVKKEVGKIDIIVNNAGVASGKLFEDCTDKMIDLSFDVNVKSHLYIAKNFLPKMLEDDEGHIVTIASVAGKMVGEGMTDYAASKHGAVGFHECLASEIATADNPKTGVKFTLVCPFYIHTPMFDTLGAQTAFPTLFPFLTVEYVVRKIIEAVQTEQEFLVMPRLFYVVIATLPWMPYKVQNEVGKYLNLIQDVNRFNRK